MPDPVVVIREDGTIALANRQAATLLGYTPDELVASYPKTHPTMKPFDFQACRGDAASNLIRAERRRVGGQNISVAISSRASLQSAISARIFGAPSSSRATNIAN